MPMKNSSNDFKKKFDKEIKTGLISLLVLIVIARNPKPSYGYQIIKKLETLSNGKFKFPEGTIYPVLSTLTVRGLLTSYWGDALEGPRRKYYKLTPEGKAALKIILNDWLEVVNVTDIIIRSMGMEI